MTQLRALIAFVLLLASCTPDTHPPIFAQPVEITYRYGDTIPNVDAPTILNFQLPTVDNPRALCDHLGGTLTTPTLCTQVDY